MFEKIKQKIASLQAEPARVDVSRFDDPIAESTDWFPLKRGGTNFRTHSLVEDGRNRLVYKASIGAQIFSGIFAISGIVFVIIFVSVNSGSGSFLFDFERLIITGIGLIFTGVGFGLAYYFNKPIVFDRRAEYFWKGRKVPEMYSPNNPKDSVRLSEIHALQILAEYVRSDKSSYYSYELNLVLKNGSRFNVVDYGNLTKIREDAEKISRFLGKPVWDFTESVRR